MNFSRFRTLKKCLLATVLAGYTCSHSLSRAEELSILTANKKIWESNATNFSNKYRNLDWDKNDDLLECRDSGLKLWSKPVSAVKLIEERGILVNLNFELVSPEAAEKMAKSKFDAEASKWKKYIDSKFGSKGKVLASTKMGSVSQVRVGWSLDNSILILSAHYDKQPQLLEISFYEKEAGIAQTRLKGQLKDGIARDSTSKKIKPGDTESSEDGEVASSSKEVKEIRKMIREISARKAPNGVSKKVQDAVNLLNVYRYLSSVPYNVKAKKSMIKASEDAASICREKGQLSHGFGHSTDKCNLAMNSADLTMENSVMQYIQDSGDNNRAARGHRRWCLNHKMGSTGFGIDGAYSAMYSLDQSARGIRKDYSYPGHGFYPIKYLHGNGWSYYTVDGPAPKDAVIEVWKLRKKDDKLPPFSKEPEGQKLPVAYKNISRNNIVFEPESSPITRKGYYLVRIKGSGLRKQYLVKLF